MSQQLQQAMAAGNLAEAGTLALALARLGELAIIDLIGLTGLLTAQGRTEQTISLYQLWLEHCDSPLEYVAWYNLAVVQLQAGDEAGAERGYRQSLRLRPGFTESQLGLGALLERQRQPEAALAQWRTALDDLDTAAAASPVLQIRLYNNIGRLAEAQGDLPQAEQALLHSLQLDPRQPLIAPQWLNLRRKLCAWPVVGFVPGLSESALRHATSALAMLDLSDDPARQLAAAQREVRATLPPAPAPLADGDGYGHRKLRVGYLSCDFGAQPVGRMVAEVLELHDRGLVEVYGFCWSPEDGSALRQRLLRGMDLHVPIATLSDAEAAQAIRSHEIDILVDLHGRLPGARPGILQHRAAPVQIAWLGQPGTSAMAAIDYVLADAVTLPPALAPHYTEQPLYLPHCFQPQDRRRPLAPLPSRPAMPSRHGPLSCSASAAPSAPSSRPTAPSWSASPFPPATRKAALTAPAPSARAALGLPEPGFVYCCFSAPEHITPERFATWMRILHQVPDSVLWLQSSSEPVRDNLRVAAMQRGVPSERLCFAEPASPDQQAARWLAADLFLDTAPHASADIAGEVLWAGLPLLTSTGRGSASRTSASLLLAAGLPELVTASEQKYEARAVRLAERPKELARLRNRLRKHRDSAPLFDTPQLVADLEQLYLRVAKGVSPALANAARAAAAATRPGPPGTAHDGAASGVRGAGLVSILIPADDPLSLETTLLSALAQTYAHCEIIVGDSSPGGACLPLLKPHLKAHRRLRYAPAPGLTPLDNLNHCLALALGAYIAVAPAGDTLAPDKIAVMLPYFLDHPHVSLVACWRQPRAPDGQALPAAPLFADEIAVGGGSLAELLLSGDSGATAAVCAPGALLYKRAGIGPAFGHYHDRPYLDRADVATALTALAGGDYVYLPRPLSSYRAAPAAAATPLARLEAGIEALELLFQARTHGHRFEPPERFRQLLSARLAELNTLVVTHYVQLAADAAHRVDALQRTMRVGYQLLLTA
ncbi:MULTISPECIES: glycosyltransferase [unclassified Duganella]|uniref:O-linked N-acetylglucosamine transferase family protein n=1 Tax=unclassified Duganella TaxID=2636909 RepID=UPI001E29E2FA|nr:MULTISPECIES: glycosyltransferase [unclassified Duganella]